MIASPMPTFAWLHMDQPQQKSSSDGSPPSRVIQQRAIAAVKMHPQYLEVGSSYWSVPKVKLVPAYFIERLRWDEKKKQPQRNSWRATTISFLSPALPQQHRKKVIQVVARFTTSLFIQEQWRYFTLQRVSGSREKPLAHNVLDPGVEWAWQKQSAGGGVADRAHSKVDVDLLRPSQRPSFAVSASMPSRNVVIP